MPQPKTVLFLGTTETDARSRAAESAFNRVAARMGLPWRAATRGLMGDAPITADDLAAAAARVAVNRADHEPLLRDRFPEWAEKIEYWQLAVAEVAHVEQNVAALVARLLGGKAEPDAPPPSPAKPEPPKKPRVVKLSRETAGRRGKGVTVVSDLPLDDAGLHDLATTLKQKCGTGGTAKDGRIEIQGDHRDRLAVELEKLGYKVKRAGG